MRTFAANVGNSASLPKQPLADVRARALRSLIPPPRLQLSDWIERQIVLPEGGLGAARRDPPVALSTRDCGRYQ